MKPMEYQKDKHSACSVYDQGRCQGGEPGTCPGVLAYERRQSDEAGAWSPLEVRKEIGGLRHYLDGKPIHCGGMIELQATEKKYDDYGEYPVPLQEGVVVRYEADLHGAKPNVTLYLEVKGHLFTTLGKDWMRFRWPRR